MQRFVSRVLMQACDDDAEPVRFETPKDLDHFLVLGIQDGEETVMFRPPASWLNAFTRGSSPWRMPKMALVVLQ